MRFDYFEPTTVGEAVKLLQNYGDKAKVIAGGTDLIVQMKDRAIRPECVISLGRIAGLDHIKNNGVGLSIGALATMSNLWKHAEVGRLYPAVSQAAGQVSIAIRNMATVGGNICTASPAADTPPALIASGALLRIAGPTGERELKLEEFFLGPGATVLGKSEIVTALNVPSPSPRTGAVYLKYAIKGSSDLSIVGVAVLLSLSNDGKVCKRARIALGAVAPTPMRAPKAEGILEGERIRKNVIEESARLASGEVQPIDDLRATAEYRKEMTYVFTRRAIDEALRQVSQT